MASGKMATPAGVEPATSNLEGSRSIQLSYGATSSQAISATAYLSIAIRFGAGRQTELHKFWQSVDRYRTAPHRTHERYRAYMKFAT